MNYTDPFELLAIVDERDRVIGSAARRDIHSKRLLHRSVQVLILDEKDRLYLQLRSEEKDTFPLCWTVSASGHVDPGEEYGAAAQRELMEEIGLTAELTELGKIDASHFSDREFSMVYLGRAHSHPRPNPQEIKEGGFFTFDQVRDIIQEGRCTPYLKKCLAMLEALPEFKKAARARPKQAGEYFMTSKRLGFSSWQKNDIIIALELWGDSRVSGLICANGGMTPDQVRERLDAEIKGQRDCGIQYWPIFMLGSGEHAGCCGLRPYGEKPGVLEIGFHLRPKFWGQGLAGEAARRVMRHAFEELKADALFAGHNPRNEASAGLLKKLGFQHTHDEFYQPTGLMHPSYLMSHADYKKITEQY